MEILVINGANLNMTGTREKEHYGNETLSEINAWLSEYASTKGCKLSFIQSNSEGSIIDEIQAACKKFDALIINAGAYSHYSYAIADAIKAVQIPAIEVHMSNVFSREQFRHESVIAPVCIGSICGLGKYGYRCAIDYVCECNANE